MKDGKSLKEIAAVAAERDRTEQIEMRKDCGVSNAFTIVRSSLTTVDKLLLFCWNKRLTARASKTAKPENSRFSWFFKAFPKKGRIIPF